MHLKVSFAKCQESDKVQTHAPLYCATSSPRTNTFSLLSNSSANASFKASRTVYSFPAGVAYVRILGSVGTEAAGRKDERTEGESGRFVRTREAGRKSLEATIMNYVAADLTV
jgi:hypothetical protein